MPRLRLSNQTLAFGLILAGLIAALTPPTTHAFGYCEGGDGATDGRPTACNFGWSAGTTFNGQTYKGNAHWWLKFYWDQQATLDTLRSDGKARLELEPYKNDSIKTPFTDESICDKFSYASPALRNVTFPNWRHFESPPKNGCGNVSIKEEWKIEFTNTKKWPAWPTHSSYELSADMNTHTPMGEKGVEANVSWVRVIDNWFDPDIWLGKLTDYCDLGGGIWSPKHGNPAVVFGFANPSCP